MNRHTKARRRDAVRRRRRNRANPWNRSIITVPLSDISALKAAFRVQGVDFRMTEPMVGTMYLPASPDQETVDEKR